MQPRKNGDQIKCPWSLPDCLPWGRACLEVTHSSLLHKSDCGPWPPVRTLSLGFGTRHSFRSGSSRLYVQWSALAPLTLQHLVPKLYFLGRLSAVSTKKRNTKLYINLFTARKHLLLRYVLQGNLASHIHKRVALSLIVQLTGAIKQNSWLSGEEFEGEANEPTGPLCLEENPSVNCTP